MAEKEDLDAIETVEEAINVDEPTSNWWSPWFDAAKSKSSEVLEFVKRDLSEITTVVKSEANAVVNSTASVLKDTLKLEEPDSTANSMKRSVSSFLDTVSNVLNPAIDDECEEAILIQNSGPVTLSRFQTRLLSLSKNAETFTTPIAPALMPQFESWLTVCDEQMTTDKLSKLLMSSTDLHNFYETLVPEKVSHMEFWQRYLFRKALLEDEESMREAQEKKDKALAERVQWEKEDFAQGIDLSEEEQVKILEEYEKEQKKPKDDTTTSDSENKKAASNELIMKEKQGMIVIGESRVSSSSAETESKDTDDWDDLEDLNEPPAPAPAPAPAASKS